MKFYEITEELKVFPGEYVLHTPTQQIALVGSFNRAENKIRALINGKMVHDQISNFHKIQLSKKEKEKSKVIKRCKGCRG